MTQLPASKRAAAKSVTLKIGASQSAIWTLAILAVATVTIALFSGAVAAQERSSYLQWESLYTQTVTAGPYKVTVHYTQWPVRSRTNQRFIITVDGGIAGKSGRWQWFPDGGQEGSGFRSLRTYPGLENAWMIEVAGMIDPGEWRWIFEIDGPQGRGIGGSEPFTVGDPPGFPIWLGWLLGLFPVYGLIWFGLREARRTRRLIQSGDLRL